MKLLFASDIHGSATHAKLLMERIDSEQPDRVVLLGDLLYHGPRNDLPEGYAPKQVIPLLNSLKDRIIAVRGNCDSEVDQMVLEFPCMADYTMITLENGDTLFITHGHLWTPEDTETLPEAKVFVSGHTHIKQIDVSDGRLVLNPGSISLPKDGSRSYATYEEDMFSLRSLDGDTLVSVRMP